MTPDYDAPRLDELIRRLLDGKLMPAEKAELESTLRGSRHARDHYRRSLRLHALLIRQVGPPRAAVRKPARAGYVVAAAAIAACLLLGVWLAWPARDSPAAWLSGSRGAIWSRGTAPGDLTAHPLELTRGFAELTYRNGVRVTLEGPCRFRVTDASTLTVDHGRVSVQAPEKKPRGFAFHLDTPGGRLTDLGTEFGVSIGRAPEGPVVLTEVFDGEIEVPGESGRRKRMRAGDAGAIIRERGGNRFVTSPADDPMDLGNVARRLPHTVDASEFPGNLALGKPVTTPAYLNKALGSTFPPDNLTDGRLNDTGTPGDWSFWLAPDGQSGQFTIDLRQSVTVNRIVMQNTRNRGNGDRGLRQFAVLVSEDNEVFREIFRGEMARVKKLPPPGTDFSFETFTFPPASARYVKITGLSHYRSETRRPDHKHYDLHSGGLNEVMIFGP